jgi:hypothetical protein
VRQQVVNKVVNTPPILPTPAVKTPTVTTPATRRTAINGHNHDYDSYDDRDKYDDHSNYDNRNADRCQRCLTRTVASDDDDDRL